MGRLLGWVGMSGVLRSELAMQMMLSSFPRAQYEHLKGILNLYDNRNHDIIYSYLRHWYFTSTNLNSLNTACPFLLFSFNLHVPSRANPSSSVRRRTTPQTSSTQPTSVHVIPPLVPPPRALDHRPLVAPHSIRPYFPRSSPQHNAKTL
jgi:hypothetical protein